MRLYSNDLVREIAESFGSEEPDFDLLLRVFHEKVHCSKANYEKFIAPHIAEIYLRQKLLSRMLVDRRVKKPNFIDSKPGAKYNFVRDPNGLVSYEGEKQRAEYDQIIGVDNLVISWEITLSPAPRRRKTKKISRFKRESVVEMLEPVVERFGKRIGQVIVCDPRWIGSYTGEQEFRDMGGIIAPLPMNGKQWYEKVNELRGKYGL